MQYQHIATADEAASREYGRLYVQNQHKQKMFMYEADSSEYPMQLVRGGFEVTRAGESSARLLVRHGSQ